jgi:lipopolysaccharide/colanic/teichoic acid biosynthesis glycosyltransferase
MYGSLGNGMKPADDHLSSRHRPSKSEIDSFAYDAFFLNADNGNQALGKELEPLEPSKANPCFRSERSMDIVIALSALLILMPIIMAAIALIKLTSRGPVIFRQERIGKNGRPFTMYKFRTMHIAAKSEFHERHAKSLMDEDLPMLKMDAFGDPRIIPLGSLLRATAIDELPQLINVIRGEMSIVGPRPCLPFEYNAYNQLEKARFDTLPGMTGLWQVSGKNRLTFRQMVRLDVIYSRGKSARSYLRIIFRTPMVLAQQTIAAFEKHSTGARFPARKIEAIRGSHRGFER